MNELWGLDLPQLNVLLQMENTSITDISSAPVTATSGDDSFLVILSGDVMFEFNKSVICALEQTKFWSERQGRSNPRSGPASRMW
jgi:hypothetical protein